MTKLEAVRKILPMVESTLVGLEDDAFWAGYYSLCPDIFAEEFHDDFDLDTATYKVEGNTMYFTGCRGRTCKECWNEQVPDDMKLTPIPWQTDDYDAEE